jgi:hypothetical protein
MFDSSASSSKNSMILLSNLLLSPDSRRTALPRTTSLLEPQLLTMSREQFEELVALAGSNHVIVRAMERLLPILRDAGDETRCRFSMQFVEPSK